MKFQQDIMRQKLNSVRTLISLTLLCFCLSISVQAQYALKEIQETQSFYLNNSTRGILGTGDNRTYFAISLPANTVEWYYSFSATKNNAGESLNLFSQLFHLIDKSGISSTVFNAVAVPEGNVRCNIYVTDEANAIAFDHQQSFNHYPSAARMDYSQGLVRITDVLQNPLYLCFENPNDWEGITIRVEITALIDTLKSEVPQSDAEKIVESLGNVIQAIQENKKEKQDQRKLVDEGQNYWNTGWVLYKSGDFQGAIKYNKKALETIKHPALYFNLGIAQWSMGNDTSSLKSYLNGLNLIYSLNSKEEAIKALESGIEDIQEGTKKYHFYEDLPPAYELLKLKLIEIEGIDKWKKKY